MARGSESFTLGKEVAERLMGMRQGPILVRLKTYPLLELAAGASSGDAVAVGTLEPEVKAGPTPAAFNLRRGSEAWRSIDKTLTVENSCTGRSYGNSAGGQMTPRNFTRRICRKCIRNNTTAAREKPHGLQRLNCFNLIEDIHEVTRNESISSFARVRRIPSPLELLAYKHQERRSIAFQPVWEEDLGGFPVVIMATLQNLSQVFC